MSPKMQKRVCVCVYCACMLKMEVATARGGSRHDSVQIHFTKNKYYNNKTNKRLQDINIINYETKSLVRQKKKKTEVCERII